MNPDTVMPRCVACGGDYDDHVNVTIRDETILICPEPGYYVPMDEKGYTDLTDEARLERWESER